jgi:hypothetical protein
VSVRAPYLELLLPHLRTNTGRALFFDKAPWLGNHVSDQSQLLFRRRAANDEIGKALR